MSEHIKGPGLDFVRVQWADAQDLGQTWADAETVEQFSKEPCLIISYGYLVKSTKAYVTLAADFVCGNGDFGRVTKIPKPWVRSMQTVKEKA